MLSWRSRAAVVVIAVVVVGILVGALAQSPQKSKSPSIRPRPTASSPRKPVPTPSLTVSTPDATPVLAPSKASHYSGDVPCADFQSCSECSGRWDCVWCEGSKVCINGNVLGPSSTCSGNDWRYKQCFAKGVWVELGVSGGALLLLILLASCCVWRCCCRRPPPERSITKATKESRRLLDDVDSAGDDAEKAQVSLHPKNDQKRIELSEKYGLDFGAARVRSFNGMKPEDTNPFK
jgi:hypothetical protein